VHIVSPTGSLNVSEASGLETDRDAPSDSSTVMMTVPSGGRRLAATTASGSSTPSGGSGKVSPPGSNRPGRSPKQNDTAPARSNKLTDDLTTQLAAASAAATVRGEKSLESAIASQETTVLDLKSSASIVDTAASSSSTSNEAPHVASKGGYEIRLITSSGKGELSADEQGRIFREEMDVRRRADDRKNILALQSQLVAADTKAMEFHMEVERLQGKLQALAAKHEAAKTQCNEFKSKCSKLADELATTRAGYDKMMNEMTEHICQLTDKLAEKDARRAHANPTRMMGVK